MPQPSKDSGYNIQGSDTTEPSNTSPLQPVSIGEESKEATLLEKSTAGAQDLGRTPVREVQGSKRVIDIHNEINAAEKPITTELRRSSSVNDATSKPGRHGDSNEDRKDPNPPVAYLEDVVIDMAGYHSKEQSDRTVHGRDEMVDRILSDGDMPASAAENAQALLM